MNEVLDNNNQQVYVRTCGRFSICISWFPVCLWGFMVNHIHLWARWSEHHHLSPHQQKPQITKLLYWPPGSKLPWFSRTLCHFCSSSGKPSILMAEGDLYCHDHRPMAAPVDQSNLIWLEGILKEQPDGSHQSQSVHCRLWFTSCSQKAALSSLKDDAAPQSWRR